jgi:Icc protein
MESPTLPSPPASSSDTSVLIAQLSDSHLFADADSKLLGMNTADSLQRVIDRLLTEQPRIDLMLATGDLSQDGTIESYQRFLNMTACIPAPARWMPGNHDEYLAMNQFCADTDRLEPVIDVGGWRIILLNTAVPGDVYGLLAEDQLRVLQDALQQAPQRPSLICLHHHPVSIGSAWMEPIGLHNAAEFFAVTDRYPQVRGIVWGHVHQEFDQLRKGVRLLATPSTCVQFAPGSKDFQADKEAPGYRWLRLHAEGRLETGVSRVADIDFEIDYSCEGY